jgi:hypothetical protein
MDDGIHLEEAGDRMIAELLDGCLAEAGLWDVVLAGEP